MKLLLVDDEEKFALMLAKRLELRGMQVEVCFCGDKALSKVEAGSRYDIALLDVKMPGIGGIELKQRLHKEDSRMKFIFLTGHGSAADFEAGAREADAYLSKPLKIEELIETIHRLKPNQ